MTKRGAKYEGGVTSTAFAGVAALTKTLVAYLGLVVIIGWIRRHGGDISRWFAELGCGLNVAKFSGSLVVNLLSAAVVLLYARASGVRVKDMGLKGGKAVGYYVAGAAISCGMIALIAFLCYTMGDVRFVGLGIDGAIPIELLAVMVLSMTNVREELLFRGWMMGELRGRIPAWAVVAVSSLIFGLSHLGNPHITTLALVNLTLLGLFWALCLLSTGSLWMVMAMHSFWNFAQSRVVGLPVSGGKMPTEAVVQLAPTGEGPFPLGPFGLEGSPVATVVIITAIVSLGIIWRYNRRMAPLRKMMK